MPIPLRVSGKSKGLGAVAAQVLRVAMAVERDAEAMGALAAAEAEAVAAVVAIVRKRLS